MRFKIGLNRWAKVPLLVLTIISLLLIEVQMVLGQEFKPGEIVVKFQKGIIALPEGANEASIESITVNSPDVSALNAEVGVTRVQKVFPEWTEADSTSVSKTGERVKLIDLSQVYRLLLPQPTDIDSIAKRYSSLSEVDYAEPNYICHALTTPDDPYFNQQWGLDQPNDIDIDAPEGWDINTGNNNIILAFIDTGIDYTHSDLGGGLRGYPNEKVIQGYDYINDDSDPIDDNTDSHGTHVAGIAGALTDNGYGVASVSGGWNLSPLGCKLMPVKVLDSQGYGNATQLADGIEYARSHGADVISMSLGFEPGVRPGVVHDALWNASAQGCLLVAAMGNDNSRALEYPAAWSEFVCAVGAINSSGGRASFSNYGNQIDVAAPGVDILSTIRSGGYGTLDGTSMATPFVTGIAGLILSATNLPISDVDIEEIIKRTASDINASLYPGYDIYLGYGLPKARAAIDFIQAQNCVPHGSSGSYAAGNTDGYYVTFYSLHHPHDNSSLSDLGSGTYIVKRYERRANITFPWGFEGVPYVWARPNGTKGWRYLGSGSSVVYYINDDYAEIVPGTLTSIGCTLRAYVYKIYNILGEFVGWYPCEPSEVTFAYTALGKLSPRTFVDDCGDPDNEPHLIRGEDYTFPGDEGIHCRTVSKDPSEVIYRYTNLIPTNTYKVYVDYYWEEEDKLDPPVRLTLWADSQELHGSYEVYPGECDFLGPYTVNSSEYADGNFDLKVLNHSGRYAVVSYITVVEVINVGTQQPPENDHLPQSFELSQNYPNPFNSNTAISYQLSAVRPLHTTLTIYNVAGQKVRTLVNGQKEAGSYRVCWNGKDDGGKPVASGVYFYRIQAGDFVQSRRMILLK